MRRPSKKTPRWLYAALAFLLAALVLAVLLPTEEKSPVSTQSNVVIVGSTPERGSHDHLKSVDGIDFAYEELTEAKHLQAPKDVSAAKQNGHPEPGIALVLDDVGYDLKALKRVLALPFPVAISILPDSPKAAEAATMAHEAGKVVMLHLPMEPTTPKYRARMTDAFLHMNLNEAQVRERFYLALQQVPYVTGVNNHMGSLLTTLEAPMKWVMQVCKEHSLFFIDSKTSHNSVAANIASQYGLAWATRRIFLDHTVEAEDLRLAWGAAVRCAEQKNSCIVIGHPHAETLNFLEQQVAEKDYHLIHPVTSMLHAGGRS
jgi:polysaccharide deacetylase 2 family uncharacterized protein YibQ